MRSEEERVARRWEDPFYACRYGGNSLAEPGAIMRSSAFGPTLAASGTCVPTSGRCDPIAKSRAGSRRIKFGSASDAFSVGSSRSAVVLSLRILDERVPRGAEPTTGEK